LPRRSSAPIWLQLFVSWGGFSYRYVLLTRWRGASPLCWPDAAATRADCLRQPQQQQLQQLRRRRAQMANIWQSYQSRRRAGYRSQSVPLIVKPLPAGAVDGPSASVCPYVDGFDRPGPSPVPARQRVGSSELVDERRSLLFIVMVANEFIIGVCDRHTTSILKVGASVINHESIKFLHYH